MHQEWRCDFMRSEAEKRSLGEDREGRARKFDQIPQAKEVAASL